MAELPVRRPETWLRFCELTCDAINASRWKSSSTTSESERRKRKDYASLWHGMMFSSSGTPVWQNAFVMGFTQDELPAQRQRLLRAVGGDTAETQPVEKLRLLGLLDALRKLDSLGPDEGQSMQAGYETAVNVLRAAQLGMGAPKEAEFLAEAFCAGGRVVALKDLEDPKLFAALEFPLIWNERFSDARVQSVIGASLKERARRTTPGLGDANATVAQPLGYRDAAWLSMSLYMQERLTPPMKALADGHKKIAEPSRMKDRVTAAYENRPEVLDAIMQVILTRVNHNSRIAEFAALSAQDAATPAASDARLAAWDWYRTDADTLQWMRGTQRWPLLKALWAPCAEFSGLTGDDSARGLDVDADWSETTKEERLFSLVLLLDQLAIRDGRLLVREKDEEVFAQVALPEFCADSTKTAERIAEWTRLPALKHARARQRDISATDAYAFQAIARTDLEFVYGGVWRNDLLDVFAPAPFPIKSPADAKKWCDNYEQKEKAVKEIESVNDALFPRGFAVEILRDTVTRATPWITVFKADPGQNGVRLVRLEGAIDEVLIARGEQRCLVQCAVLPTGEMFSLPSGNLNLVDRYNLWKNRGASGGVPGKGALK